MVDHDPCSPSRLVGAADVDILADMPMFVIWKRHDDDDTNIYEPLLGTGKAFYHRDDAIAYAQDHLRKTHGADPMPITEEDGSVSFMQDEQVVLRVTAFNGWL